MLAMLAAISPTNQAFAYSSYHKAYYKGLKVANTLKERETFAIASL
jgi:hypothetical protein